MGGASHTSKPMKKMGEIIGDFSERTCNKNVSFAYVFRLHFGINGEFMPFYKRLYACGSSRVSCAIDCLGNMSDSFEPNLVEGMEELYCILELIKFPFQSQMIQLAGPSIMWNHMCMSMNLRNS